MACSSCSAGLIRLPQRIAASARQSLPDVSLSRSLSTRATATSPSLPLATKTSASAPSRTPQRAQKAALHTTSPQQKFNLKQMLLGRVAQSLSPGKSSYYIYGATENLYKACAAQADYAIEAADRKAGKLRTTADGEEIGLSKGGPWHSDLGLLPTFSTWAHVTMLHMYLLVVRFRCLDRAAQQAWQAQLVNHFFYQAEAKMEDVHDLTSRMIRQRYLKDLFVQWRGLILAYDEGLVKGDAVLASAVWRNLFKASEDVDARALAAVVAWLRAGVERLGNMTDETIERMGTASPFHPLTAEFKMVDLPTASMKAAFEKAGLVPEARSA